MASHSLSPDFPNRHSKSPTVKDVQVMLDDLFTMRVERANLAQEYAASVAQLQPPDLQKRVAAIEQAHATALAQLQPPDLEKRRAAIEQKRNTALAELLPPDFQERVAAIEQAHTAAMAQLQPRDLEKRRAAIEQQRAVAMELLLPPDFQERREAIDQEFADRQAHMAQAVEAREEEIRAAGRKLGVAVRGVHLQTTYTPGRRSWNSDRLLALAKREPEIQTCLHIGEPVVSIRTITQRHPPAPLLYDVHT